MNIDMPEFYIDHETRIRLLNELAKDTRDLLHHMENKIDTRFQGMDNKIDNQFKWTIGMFLTIFVGVIATKFI